MAKGKNKSIFDRPVALGIGPQRCGTSWIYEYLKMRGDICLPSVKEIFYFDRHFQRGPEFYASHFDVQPQHRLVMELTTTAFDNPDAPDHVHKLFGTDVKLICPLRRPAERSKAIYADYLRYGLVQGGIEEAVERVPQILFASRYADRLEGWLTQFGKENIHFVFYETLQHSPQKFVEELCRILEIPFIPPAAPNLWTKIKDSWFPKNSGDIVLERKQEQWLKDRLDPEIPRLENLLGKSLSIWKH